MELEKQAIRIGKTIFEGDIKTSAEGSIIVPDVKPDILKVLQVSAEPYLTEKTIETGKITLKGKVRVNVLYLPEGDLCKMTCLNSCFDFYETLKRAEFDENMSFSAVCDVEKVSYKIINSRKIGIDTKLIVNVTVSENCEMETVSSDSLCNAEKKEKTMKFCVNDKFSDFEFSVSDDVKLPQGKKASDILKCDISAMDKDYKALDGKLIAKGKLGASVLYCDLDGAFQHLDYEMPFTEVFDIDELLEGSDLEVNYEIGEMSYSLADEETFKISASVTVNVRTENFDDIPILCDCYFTDSACEFSLEPIKMQEVVARPQYSTMVKQLLQKEQSAPDILGVYKVQAKPYITSTQIQNGKIFVSGKILVYVLYLTDNAETPVAAIKEEMPFNHNLDCEGNVRDGNKAVLGVECEHISYTISSKDTVEIRCGLFISGKLINEFDENIIKDIKIEPKNEKESGISVYFAKKGDNLWEIGKNYNVRVASILKANNIDEGYAICDGDKLIIPIS